MYSVKATFDNGVGRQWRFANLDDARLGYYRILNDAKTEGYVAVTLTDIIHGWEAGRGTTD